MSNNEHDDDVIPKEMLAPLYLWAPKDDAKDETSKSSTKLNYLAPFVATPSSEAKIVIESLKENSMLPAPTNVPNEGKNYSICDIGCGDGSFLVALRSEIAETLRFPNTNVKAFGLDIDEVVIETAKKNFPDKNLAEFHTADICAFQNAEDVMSKVFSNPTLKFDGIYLYLYPEAMKQIEKIIFQMIELFSGTLKWIVTRRWNFGKDDLLLSSKRIKLVEIVASGTVGSVVSFYLYEVL